jgi:glc operon protein GlcG
VAEAKKSPRNWKLAISVVDPNGDLVYFYKMDQTQIASVGISQGKARTAARFRRPSQLFFNVMQTPAGGYASTLDPTLVASPGGFPLVEGGKIIGAIGCSGATGDQDAVACKAGADTIK